MNQERLPVILAEYGALRQELMTASANQQKAMFFLSTTSVGQVLGSFLIQTKVDPMALTCFYLLFIPVVVFMLMLKSLECTCRIVLVADYIHKGIKQQIAECLDPNARYFEWEEHKLNSNRVDGRLVRFLDYSKWYVFVVGLLLAYFLAVLVQVSTTAFERPLPPFVASAVLVTCIIAVCLRWGKVFNEAQGEARFPYCEGLAATDLRGTNSESSQ